MKIAEILEIASNLRKYGKWQCIWQHNKPYAIRDKAGLLCTITHPNKYTDQEERCQQESKETIALAEFITCGPEMESKLRAIHALMPEIKEKLEKTENFFLQNKAFYLAEECRDLIKQLEGWESE